MSSETRHTIRLREPWEVFWEPPVARLRRRFGRPTGMEPTDRVLLVVDAPRRDGQMRVNEQSVVRFSAGVLCSADVTKQLEARNVVELECLADERCELADLCGEVRLEILGGEERR